MTPPRRLIRERAEAAVASLVAVRAHEIPPLMNAAATFFFVSLLPSIHLMVSPILQPPESKDFVLWCMHRS